MPKVKENPLTGKTKSGKVLTSQEKLFCEAYIWFFGNGTEAAEEAYDVDKNKPNWKNTCASIAKENLRKPHILEYIRDIMDEQELTDESVDNELNFLLKQKADLNAKKGAIDIYNKVKGRYQKDNEQKTTHVVIEGFNYIKPNETNTKANSKTTSRLPKT